MAMYLSGWIIGLIILVIVCLIIRVEKLRLHVKKQRKVICDLEGVEDEYCKDEDLGDIEGKS